MRAFKLKYLFAFLIISILVACSNEDSNKENSEKNLNEELQQTIEQENIPEKPADLNSIKDSSVNNSTSNKMVENVSLVKQCQNNQCESYHLMINKQPVVSVTYSNKKMNRNSFVLTKNNIQSFNGVMNEMKKLGTGQLISCLNSKDRGASYSLTLGDVPNETSYLFAVGCQGEPVELLELARWFDNKAYAAVEN